MELWIKNNYKATNISLLQSCESKIISKLQTCRSYGAVNQIQLHYYKHFAPTELWIKTIAKLQTLRSYGAVNQKQFQSYKHFAPTELKHLLNFKPTYLLNYSTTQLLNQSTNKLINYSTNHLLPKTPNLSTFPINPHFGLILAIKKTARFLNLPTQSIISENLFGISLPVN